MQTHLLNIVSGFSTSFDKHYIQFFGLPFSFLNRNLPGVNQKKKKKESNMQTDQINSGNLLYIHMHD